MAVHAHFKTGSGHHNKKAIGDYKFRWMYDEDDNQLLQIYLDGSWETIGMYDDDQED